MYKISNGQSNQTWHNGWKQKVLTRAALLCNFECGTTQAVPQRPF